MNLPEFTAEATLYQTPHTYRGVLANPQGPALIVPALPTCANCEWACDRCFDCVEAGGSFSRCRTCSVCNYCAGRSCSGGGIGGQPLPPCEFLVNPQPGVNCRG